MSKILQFRDENKIERLTAWLDEIGDNALQYIEENSDYIEPYWYLLEEGNIHLGELDDDVKEKLESLIKAQGIDFLFDNDLIEADIHHGINRRSNELWSFSIGEHEEQFTGMYDHETKSICIYSDLIKGMTSKDIEEAKNACEYYIKDEYLYIEMSYDRVSFTLKEEQFRELYL